MQLVGAGLCSARQDTPNYRKSSANPYALTRVAVEADAGHSRSRRRSVTDVGLPLAGTHRPGRMHRFYGNLRRICNFSMGRQSCRPLQQPFALSVGADDSVCPRDVPILRESSANSQLPPTSKEVTACGFAANSRRNSLHSAGRAEPRPYQLRLHFNGFCVKQTIYGLKLMTLPLRGSWLRSEAEQTDEGTEQFRFAVKFQQFDTSPL